MEEMKLQKKVSREDAKTYIRKKTSESLDQQQQKKPKKTESAGVEIALSDKMVSNVYAWGDNRHGQLGINNYIPKVTKPYLFT